MNKENIQQEYELWKNYNKYIAKEAFELLRRQKKEDKPTKKAKRPKK